MNRNNRRKVLSSIGVAAVLFSVQQVQAYDEIVEKEAFELPSYTTMGGETIKDVRIGWEAYGTLNDAKDNVILITHFYSGNSHAAGRYAADGAPGYWDSIIGSGKPIDTDKYSTASKSTACTPSSGRQWALCRPMNGRRPIPTAWSASSR